MSGPYEELTTVQTIADDQTEVASKTNTLLSTYKIDTDDIKGYEIEPFGSNKFLISVIYLLRYVQWFYAKIGLTPILGRMIAIKRVISTIKVGLISKLSNVVVYSRKSNATIGLGAPLFSAVFDLEKWKRWVSTKIGLTSAKLYDFSKAPIVTKIGIISVGFIVDSAVARGNFNSVGLSIGKSAEWNGVPIIW